MRKFILLIMLAALLSLSHAAYAATYYISPTGDNASTGATAALAWKTFNFSVPRLNPGDTLLLVSGTYTYATTGFPQFGCATAAPVLGRNGTASQPITMKAVTERGAHLIGDGTQSVLRMLSCSYWVIEGIYFRGGDTIPNAQADGSTVVIRSGSHHITFRRNLIYGNNRSLNSHGANLWDVHSSLFEENELYFMHRHGFLLFGSVAAQAPSFNVFRRNYMHSRSAADIPGGYGTGGTRGDTGISCYPCNNTIFENNIAEGWDAGFDIQAKGNTITNKFFGDIALNNNMGFLIKARPDWTQTSLENMPRNTTLTNVLATTTTGAGGIWLRGNKNTIVTNATLINSTGAGGHGVDADFEVDATGDGAYTVSGTNILIAGNAGRPFRLISQSSPLFNEVVVFGNSLAADPAIPNAAYTNVSTTDPALGTCKVFIPAASPASGTGVGGADVGANILFRYQSGVLTTTPLWNPSTGAFPCGAQVAGVNDVAGSSCFDVNERLNVNFGGCTLPGGVVEVAENFYGSCPGTGDCLGAGTPCTPQTAFALMGPGDTLNLANGTYTGDACMIDPPSGLHGTVSARITVQATNDGMVTVDGQSARGPLVIASNNYWTVRGIDFARSILTNGLIQDSTGTNIERCIFYDAGATLTTGLLTMRRSTDTTLTDVAAFGTGAWALSQEDDEDTVVLRAFLMKNNSAQSGQATRTSFRSTNSLLANVITAVDLSGGSTSIGNAMGPGSHVGYAGATTTSIRLLGNIAYAMSTQAPGVQTALMDAGMLPALIDTGDVVTTTSDNLLTLRRGATTVPEGIIWSAGAPKSVVVTDHWTDSTALATNTTEGTEAGGEGFVPVFNVGLMNLQASSQVDDGAWIRYCYTAAGALDTGCDLWPWAMNARLQNALIASGWAAQGGLDGLGATDFTAFMLGLTGDNILSTPVLTLVITIEPTGGPEDVNLPLVRACIYDDSNVLQTGSVIPISWAIGTNPSGGTLTNGGATVPVGGCVSASTLIINNAGVGYTLVASAPAVTSDTSQAFTVTATASPAAVTRRIYTILP